MAGKRFLIFLAFSLSAMFVIAADSPNTLLVQVFDDGGPRPDVPLVLTLYTYQQRSGATVAIPWYTQSGTSDTNGQFRFLIPSAPDGDILRGTLWVNEVPRPVIWPGGEMVLQVHLAHIADGREAAPFDWEQPGHAPVVLTRAASLLRFLPTLLAAILILGLVWWASERAA